MILALKRLIRTFNYVSMVRESHVTSFIFIEGQGRIYLNNFYLLFEKCIHFV